MVWAATGEHSVCPNTMVKGAPSFCFEPGDQRGRYRRAAGADRLDGRKIGRGEGGMLQHRHQHGRHADHGVAAIGGKQLEHEARLERLQQHLGRGLRHRAEHAADATAGVEQRHGRHEDVARTEPHSLGGVGPVVGKSAMMQQRALRKARGAGGILDHHRIGRLHGGKPDDPVVAGGDEGRPVVERDDLAQFAAARRDLARRLQHRIAAKRGHHEHAGRARLLQHIFDFSLRNPGLTVTSTMPAIAAPNSSITHSGRFCAHTAIRSPGLKRVSSARAVRWPRHGVRNKSTAGEARDRGGPRSARSAPAPSLPPVRASRRA